MDGGSCNSLSISTPIFDATDFVVECRTASPVGLRLGATTHGYHIVSLHLFRDCGVVFSQKPGGGADVMGSCRLDGRIRRKLPC